MLQISLFIIMKKEIIHSVIFFIYFIPLFLFPQDNDHQTWTNLELKYRYAERVDFIFDGGLRFTDNSTLLSKYFFDFSMKRKCSNIFSFALGVRPVFKKNNDLFFERSTRFYGDARFKRSINKQMDFSVRTRIQTQIEEEFGFSENVKNKIREKVKLVYNLKDFDLDVFLSLELFYLFGESFEKVRYNMGLEKALIHNLNVNINYLVQNEFNTNPRELVFVLRSNIRYNF